MPGIHNIQKDLSDDFALLSNWEEKYEYLIELGMDMPSMKPEKKVDKNLVKGCQSSVWFDVICQDGLMVFEADSDSLVVKGMVAVLYKLFNNQPAKDVLEADLSFFEELGLWRHISSQRSNGLTAMVAHLKAEAADCLSKRGLIGNKMALSYRMLQIGGQPAGLLGLEELFSALYEEGLTPSQPEITERLLAGVKQHNFIPKPAAQDYTNALVLEFQRYYQRRRTGKAIVARNYGSWRGYPREQIPWFPTISDALCNDCGACLDLCAREVYERDENGKIWVAEPFLCMVGCCFCKSVCEPKAILMPGQELLKNYPEKMR